MPKKSTFIDLFCGCGGFTLGMLRAGFHCKAAIDFNKQAIETLQANLVSKKNRSFSPVEHALERDLTQFPPEELAELVGTQSLDVIIGGPPCQGFSTARQRDGSNHGNNRFKEDPRRHLFRNFLDYVEYFQPRVFVIENVLGIRSAAGGFYFTSVQHEARILGRDKGRPGYRVHAQIEEGKDLGIPQKRRRQLIIGVRADLPGYFPPKLTAVSRATIGTKLGDAILDLPILKAGEGENDTSYNLARRKTPFLSGTRARIRKRYLKNVAEVGQTSRLMNHVARPHSERDLRDFDRIREGASSSELMREGVEFEFPYDKTTFKDRYTRQHRNRTCSTIVAHLSKDGLMFIHPTQNRSLTPREAARVQTFPDWFVFPEARTHSFRLIGNAVPPLIGEAVGNAVLNCLETIAASTTCPRELALPRKHGSIPSSQEEAKKWLHPLMHADYHAMRTMPTETFLKGWHALLWLFPELHPDNALEHGTDEHDGHPPISHLLELGRRFNRSGWPVVLVPLGKEAWRRFEALEFPEDAFYSVSAQGAGMKARQESAIIPPTAPRSHS